MFNVGEYVVHNVEGLCKIKDIVNYFDKDYYVLNKFGDSRTKIMIPVNSKLNLVRSVASKSEIDEAIKNIPSIIAEPIYDYRIRTREYDRMLKSGNIEILFKLIKSLLKQKKDKGNLTETDKKIIKMAEDLIDVEFAYSLNINQDDVKDYILNGAGI